MTTKVFKENLKAYLKGYRLIINQGGQASGKTYAILQLLASIATLEKRKNHIVVVSYALPHLKSGAMRVFDTILENMGYDLEKVKNKAENRYYLNNSMIEFFGIEGKEARAHSLRPDVIYLNEANMRISWEVFRQFYSRVQRCMFIDFNPCRMFWINDYIYGKEKNYIIIRSTYKDNPYISSVEKQYIEEKRNKPGWENWYKVYGLGEFGRLDDAIFTNWKYENFDDTLPYAYGLDFGVKHKDALVKVAVDNLKRRIYVKQELYESRLSTQQLINRLSKIISNKNSLIIADSAAPRSIADLQAAGFNARPTVKSRIVDDIKILQSYEICITEDSYDLARELQNWIWLDRKGEIPADEGDDLIDAMRYVSMFMINVNKKVLVY